jgi:hypothetical protein
MKHMMIAVLALALLAGCTTVPSDANRIGSASYVGDRGGVPIEEVIAAVPCKDDQTGFMNIHVALAAIVNPKQTTLSDLQDVRSIIFRLSPRISSAVVTVIQQRPASAEDFSTLRDSIAREANRVLSGEFSKWTSAEDYDVQIVVTSLYVTDGSVGRSAAGRQRWGW